MMGVKYHLGVRSLVKKLFHAYDTTGDGVISPEEWMAGLKSIVEGLCDDYDPAWVDANAFVAADTNGDGTGCFGTKQINYMISFVSL